MGVRLSNGTEISQETLRAGYKWAMVYLAEIVNEFEKKKGYDKDARSALAYLNLFYRWKK